jgi:hypothetical protein
MTLHLIGHVALPVHKAKGGFDHARRWTPEHHPAVRAS